MRTQLRIEFEFRVDDVDDLTGPNRLHCFEQIRKNRPEKLDVVVRHGYDDKAQPELGEILPMFQILIDGHKDIEALLGKSHELAVGYAAPALLFNGLDFVPWKRGLDAWIDTLV